MFGFKVWNFTSTKVMLSRPVFCQCGAPGTCRTASPASHSLLPFPPLPSLPSPPLSSHTFPPLPSAPSPYLPSPPLEVGPLKSS